MTARCLAAVDVMYSHIAVSLLSAKNVVAVDLPLSPSAHCEIETAALRFFWEQTVCLPERKLKSMNPDVIIC